MFKRLGNMYRHFRQTLEDGHYCAEAGSFWADVFDELKDKIPMPKWDIFGKLPTLAKLFKSNLVWTAVFAAISIESVVAGAVAIVGAGVSFYAMEYIRCRHLREQIIEETNFAGQTVRGKRGDLSRLHKAQEKIHSLSGIFNGVAPGTRAKEIEKVIESVHEQRHRVLIVESGRFGASDTRYDFSEPDRKATKSEMQQSGLKDAWEGKREDEVVERIIALERALPPQVLEKVRKRREDVAPRILVPKPELVIIPAMN